MANNNHFNLTLDTLAPTGSITRPGAFINANANLIIADTSTDEGASYMKVWFDAHDAAWYESSQNATAVQTAVDAASWEAKAATKLTGFSTDGTYYYHMILMDSVGNQSGIYHTDSIIFDTVAPDISGTIVLRDPDASAQAGFTNQKAGNKLQFTYGDNEGGSGMSVIHISGTDLTSDDVTATLGGGNANITINFDNNAVDGTKTVTFTLEDRAGNISAQHSASIVLDTHLDDPTIALKNTAGTSTLADGAHINYHEIKVAISVDTGNDSGTAVDTDIAGYKVWEDGQTEPAYTTINPVAALNETVSLELSSGDGVKTVNAKVIDRAGNVKSATAKSVRIDTVAPTGVSISSNVATLSKVSGYNTATLTLAGTDAVGIARYEIKFGDTVLSSANTSTLPASYTLNANDLGSTDGQKTITLIVYDAAGNSSSGTCVVTLDTTAPTISFGSLNAWYNDSFNVTVNTNSDAAGFYIWADQDSTGNTVPGSAQLVAKNGASQTVGSADLGTFIEGTMYLHAKVVDAVGNAAFATISSFGWDLTAPGKPTITFDDSYYNSTTASVHISASDAGSANPKSGVAYMQVTGDISNPTASGQWEAFTTARSVTLTDSDGMKSIYVKVKDAAGNESVLSNAASVELDRTTPAAVLVVLSSDDTAKPNTTPIAEFKVHISASEPSDPVLGTRYYKLYGDFSAGSQKAQADNGDDTGEWVELVYDQGQQYMTIDNLYFTSGDGTKTVYLVVKDNTGHISAAVNQDFTYDTSAPVVNITTAADYNIVSKVHVLRRNNSGTIAGKYADEVHFTFTPTEAIQAYKVVAYDTQADAEAGSAADTAIPTTNGSVNMYRASGQNSSEAVSCMIKGADFEAALGGTGNDGAHFVVVYVQDLGGTWSVAADFATE